MQEKQKNIDELIIQALKSHKIVGENTPTPASTYAISEALGISWSTANAHCYQLKDAGRITGELVLADIGSGRKMMWGLKK